MTKLMVDENDKLMVDAEGNIVFDNTVYTMTVQKTSCSYIQGCTPTDPYPEIVVSGTDELVSASFSGSSWNTFRYVITEGSGLIKLRYYCKLDPADPAKDWYETDWGTDLSIEMYQGQQIILMYDTTA